MSMADIPMKSIQWPGLPDTYTFLQKASTLTAQDAGKAADASVVGEALGQLQAGYVAADEVLGQRIDQLEAEIDTDSGEAPTLVAGTAEQLLSTTGTANPTPYTYRENASGSDRVTISQITGGTVAFNQFVSMTPGSATSKGITRTVNADGTVSFSGTADSAYTWNIQSSSRTGMAGHVILLRGCPSGGSTEGYRLQDGSNTTASRDFGDGRIYAVTHSEGKTVAQIAISDGATVTNVVFTPQYFDLTQMFGAAVAQHFLDLDTATPGAGVALFRAMFPENYYPYNAGELVSVQTSGRKSGDHTYPMDSTVELHGIPALTDDGQIEYDGDQYAPDGTVTRRYAIVDLGTLSWSRGEASPAGSGVYRFQSNGLTGFVQNTRRYLLSDGKYSHVDTASGGNIKDADKQVLIGQAIYIRDDDYDTGAAFKAAIAGTYIVYKLRDTAHTTETVSPYQEIQIAGSTEEFLPPETDTRAVAVPVGSVSLYQTNLREGLETLLDTDLAHAESIAPVHGSTASTNVASGELLMQDGKLYQATQAIVSGAEIVPGTNTQATTISKMFAPTLVSGAITSVSQDYAIFGATDSRTYVYPFGLAVAKFYFRISSNPGTTERIIANTTVKPLAQVGLTVTSQEGTYCAVFINAAGNIMINTKSSNANGTYHVEIVYPIAPYITA